MNKCNPAKQRQQAAMQHTDIGSEEATQFSKGNIHKIATCKGSNCKATYRHTATCKGSIQQLATCKAATHQLVWLTPDSKHQAANDPSNVSMSSKAASNPHSKCLKYCLQTETTKKW
jgi:hypothetical protein